MAFKSSDIMGRPIELCENATRRGTGRYILPPGCWANEATHELAIVYSETKVAASHLCLACAHRVQAAAEAQGYATQLVRFRNEDGRRVRRPGETG